MIDFEVVIYLGLAFLLPFLGVVAGAYVERRMRRKTQRHQPRVIDRELDRRLMRVIRNPEPQDYNRRRL
jgi:uncharacterized protein YneF (UPF0154 family)